MRVVVAGASGLIGKALVSALKARGDEVLWLVRRPPRSAEERQWAPELGQLDPAVLDGAAAAINLGGASVGRLPWTASYRKQLLDSRLQPTRTMAAALRQLGESAPAFLSASAVGYYGSAPGRALTEDSPLGSTFLAGICGQWEAEAMLASPRARVALLRTAPVIDRRGFLKPVLRLASLGLAGPIGSGRQIWPWISLRDEVRAVLHLIDQDIEGPVNLAGPTPADANATVRAVAAELHRPFWLPVPAWPLRAALGPAADSLLLADADVRPDVLTRDGFTFTHQSVQDAVHCALTAP